MGRPETEKLANLLPRLPVLFEAALNLFIYQPDTVSALSFRKTYYDRNVTRVNTSQSASLAETSNCVGCSPHIQQTEATSLYSESYASCLDDATLYLLFIPYKGIKSRADSGGTPKLDKEGKNVVCMRVKTPRFST